MNALRFVNDIELMLGYEVSDTIEGTVSKETQTVINACDTVLESLQGDRNWQELTTTGSIRMEQARTVESNVVTNFGSNQMTCAAGPFLSTDVGSMVFIGTTNVAYRIVAYASTSSVTLDREWVEDSISASGLEVFIGQDTYELPTDYDRHLVEKFYNPIATVANYVEIVGPAELAVKRQQLGLAFNVGEPSKCTISGLNATGTARLIHFDSVAQVPYELDYQYQMKHPQLTTDATLIAYPAKNFLYIKDLIKAMLDRDNEQSQSAQQVAQDALQGRIKGQQNKETGSESLRLIPEGRRHGRRRRRITRSR
ncbi:MAG: hypothetical protein KUG81_06875 [Gammaproteobacteria bacterium]|nr:hypothetical protein [Gammaproteobacteria bacterium]